MAVDTAAKRFSMMNFVTRPWTALFPPDGSVGDGDRSHMLFLYAGITLGAPAVATPGVLEFTVPGEFSASADNARKLPQFVVPGTFSASADNARKLPQFTVPG